MARCFASLLLALCLCPVLSAKEIAVGPQGVSAFLDSEVSTNFFIDADWNLLKATRRGVSESGEMCRIRSDCGAFRVVLR